MPKYKQAILSNGSNSKTYSSMRYSCNNNSSCKNYLRNQNFNLLNLQKVQIIIPQMNALHFISNAHSS